MTDVESSSQRATNELKVRSKESMTKDKEINNFLTTMEQTTNGNDLKDFYDQVLFNQVTNEDDEKKIMNMKYESSPFNQAQLVEISKNVEHVILLVSDKPIESRAMVVIKSLLISLERIF